MNKVQMTGWLGNKFPLKETANSCVVNFSIGTRKNYKEGGTWAKGTDYHRCVIWGKRAEFVDKLDEGTPLSIDGRLKTRSWEKDGKRSYSTEVIVDNLETFQLDESQQRDLAQGQPEADDLAF